MIAGGQVRIDKSDRSKVRAIKNEVILKMIRTLHANHLPNIVKLISNEPFPLS
jgi:uncharacterized protein (DUF111 family)